MLQSCTTVQWRSGGWEDGRETGAPKGAASVQSVVSRQADFQPLQDGTSMRASNPSFVILELSYLECADRLTHERRLGAVHVGWRNLFESCRSHRFGIR